MGVSRQTAARRPPNNRQTTARRPPGDRQTTGRRPPGHRQTTQGFAPFLPGKLLLSAGSDRMGDGYQLGQSLLAIGSGGWMGQGYGLSTQKLQYLPIQSTDFIYAVFAEEFGFIGSVILLLFLMLVAWLGLRVALRCRSNQSRLVAIGCCTILVGQSILNIAVASGARANRLAINT